MIMKTILWTKALRQPPRQATLEIPDGWYRVLSGAVKAGDCELDSDLFWDIGAVQWHELTEFPPSGNPWSTADWYRCLIRRGEPVETLCPRCHDAPVHFGYRYCKDCAMAVLEEHRRRQGLSREKKKRKS